MSQQVNASCSECREDVHLSPQAITVVDNEIDPDQSRYSFTCPKCGEAVTKPAGPEVLRLLRLARGVRWNFISLPDELNEAHEGAPLNYDDLHDFMVALVSTPDHLILQLAGG